MQLSPTAGSWKCSASNSAGLARGLPADRAAWIFSCYEAFNPIVDFYVQQHAKWLKVCREIPWRKPIASLTYLLTSMCGVRTTTASRIRIQVHDPRGHKKADIVRVYLPPDANTLLRSVDHCVRSRDYINVIVAGKQPQLQWLDMEAGGCALSAGLGVWEWASKDEGDPERSSPAPRRADMEALARDDRPRSVSVAPAARRQRR